MKFGLVLDQNKKEAVNLSAKIEDFIISRGHEVFRDDGKFKEADLVIVLCGDGLLLHSACEHVKLNIPFVGINVGKLGFLTAAEVTDWKEAIEKLIKGEYVVSERMTLEVVVEPKTVFRALNEAVVKSAYRVVDLEIAVKGQRFLTISGDGVIIATQTGSTAYSLSAGGPIVDPDVDCFLVTPINAHGLPIPSVVLSPNAFIEVKIKQGEDVFLVIDGQEHQKVTEGQNIKVEKGKYR